MFAIKITLSFILTFMVREYQNMLLKRNNSNTYILDYFLPIKKVKKKSLLYLDCYRIPIKHTSQER